MTTLPEGYHFRYFASEQAHQAIIDVVLMHQDHSMALAHARSSFSSHSTTRPADIIWSQLEQEAIADYRRQLRTTIDATLETLATFDQGAPS